jgi:hypothetical protein
VIQRQRHAVVDWLRHSQKTHQESTMSRHFDHTPPTLEQRARRRVALKASFYVHAIVFALVNSGLFLVSWIGGWGEAWGHGHRHGLVLPLWGWGLGLTIHGIVVLLQLKGEGLTKRMMDREIEALKRREGGDQP